jgi:ABC-type polar amino acid transport system ATPase subunit
VGSKQHSCLQHLIDLEVILRMINNVNNVMNGTVEIKDRLRTKKKTECVVKTHDRSETFVLQGNIVIIHQSLLNSIFTTKLYILMKRLNYKQR